MCSFVQSAIAKILSSTLRGQADLEETESNFEVSAKYRHQIPPAKALKLKATVTTSDNGIMVNGKM